MAFIDKTGNWYGEVEVLERDYSKERTSFKCLCHACGKYFTARTDRLVEGRKSCGCLNKFQKGHGLIDLTGQQFGLVKVLEFDKIENHKTFWKCECQCENKTIMSCRSDTLQSGRITSCGCLRNGPRVDSDGNYVKPTNELKNEIGNVYGALTVIDRVGTDNFGNATWLCQCECGELATYSGAQLRNGAATSCGCRRYNTLVRAADIVGQKFGKLTVVKFAGDGKWECKCECGNTTFTTTNHLRNGHTKSCGCISSSGEKKIKEVLDQNNVKYYRQFTFGDCLSDKGYPLRFDFAIFNEQGLKFLLEFDGEQHFTGWAKDPEDLKDIQRRDEIKNNYCKDNNIQLIRISYKDEKNIPEILKEYL